MNKQLKSNMLLVLTAAIWGFAFVAQRIGAEFVGAFTFNGIRFLLGSFSLIPLILIMKRKSQTDTSYIIKAGLVAGCFLFMGANLQQLGMDEKLFGADAATAGKSGFITSLYMVLIPIISIFLKRKPDKYTWTGVFMALIGLYLLCVNEKLQIARGDYVVFAGAFFWAEHVLFIDHIVKKVDSLVLSSIQFFVCGLLSLLCAFILKEPFTSEAIKGALLPICYGGFLSVGVAYTLQVVAQKDANPTHAAIIMSLESVFAAIGGMLILKETMEIKGIIGCVLIFVGILISQKLIFKKKA